MITTMVIHGDEWNVLLAKIITSPNIFKASIFNETSLFHALFVVVKIMVRPLANDHPEGDCSKRRNWGF